MNVEAPRERDIRVTVVERTTTPDANVRWAAVIALLLEAAAKNEAPGDVEPPDVDEGRPV
jgi:hypothetical protein